MSSTLRPNRIARRVCLFGWRDKYLLLCTERGHTEPDNARRWWGWGPFPGYESSSQRHRNCSSYAEFAFTFSELMKLKRRILASVGEAGADLNVSGCRISPFDLSKHPGERVYGMEWLTEFHYRGLSERCLQLSRFNMVAGFDLCRDYSYKDVRRKGGGGLRFDPLHDLDLHELLLKTLFYCLLIVFQCGQCHFMIFQTPRFYFVFQKGSDIFISHLALLFW